MKKLLLSLLSVAALGMPLASEAQVPAMPTAPVAQPDQAALKAAELRAHELGDEFGA